MICALFLVTLVLGTSPGVGAIKWIALRTAGNETACQAARNEEVLSRPQARLCREALPHLIAAAASAVSTCQQVFLERRWNCSSLLAAPDYAPDLTGGTREQGIVFAMGSAALVHTLARGCAQGSVFHCACAPAPDADPGGNFKWGGCGDNLRWATKFARQFLDDHHRRSRSSLAAAAERDIATANLHNNRVGRRLVEKSARRHCKCHGVSGSCSVRTCWKALPVKFAEAAAVQLLGRYTSAVEVVPAAAGAAGGGRLAGLRGRPYTRDDLVYLAKSPDYCVSDPRLGSVGTGGRSCNETGTGQSSCKSMCCGRGHRSRIEERMERCHCKYYWCCYVKCKTCVVTAQINKCN